MRYVYTSFLAVVLGVSTSAQPPVPGPRFEVASVKPSTPNLLAGDCKPPTCSTAFYRTPPGRFIATRMSVEEYVSVAYSMPANRVIGPDWAKTERYDIEATHGLPDSDRPGLLAMLQHLLQERFSLRVHTEQRPMPVFLLKKAREDGKLGPRLVSIANCDVPRTIAPDYVGCSVLGTSGPTTRLGRGDWKRLALSGRLEPSIDRPVIDETGLSGLFELRLDWSDDNPPAADRPSLFTALREQLGLKLEAAERPMDVLVIDTVERPTPN